MTPRRIKYKSSVPRFCAFFLAQRRDAKRLFIRSGTNRKTGLFYRRRMAQQQKPVRVRERPCAEVGVPHSIRSVRIGSVDAARRAGTIAATAAANRSSSILLPTASGSITGVW